jgi:pre-60S factor REI1
MRVKHSFILLDVDCLVDLKGLLGYIAQRIQLGNLCLLCSKQFKDPQSCQQHMVDKSHCMMNMEDEEEYVDFYDFSITYQNHPLLIKNDPQNPIAEDPAEHEEEKKEKSDEEWEECDVDDLSGEEETTEKEFQVVSESDGFSKVDAPQTNTSESFHVIDGNKEKKNIEDLCGESVSSIQSKPSAAGGRTGLTREEVFLGLNIKRAEYLPNGEIKLGNGKVIGHRKYHYIYKQKLKPVDDRESVVINKIALEYRKLRAIENGGIGDSIHVHDKKQFKDMALERDHFQKRMLN